MAFTQVLKNFSFIIPTDENDNKVIKNKILTLDGKVQQMLLWSNLSAIWGYLLLTFMIIKAYRSFNGTHQVLLIGVLGIMCLLFGIYLFVVWKSMAYQEAPANNKANKTYLNYQIGKLTGQRKVVTAYLVTNTLLLVIASLFFSLDIHAGVGSLLKIAAPASVITYALGLYFIMSFTLQRRKLYLLDKQIDHITYLEKVNQN